MKRSRTRSGTSLLLHSADSGNNAYRVFSYLGCRKGKVRKISGEGGGRNPSVRGGPEDKELREVWG